jgi:hypothetical protein
LQEDVGELEDLVYKPDTFGTIRAMGIDKYPGEMPIARELIQNADDAAATFVRFKLWDHEIVVENDGRPFTKPDEIQEKEKSDFFRISHIGLGKKEEEMTGTFGIGFTSVFHITDTPRIVSNGWDFEIHVNDLPTRKYVPFDAVTRLHLPLRLTETELSRKISAEPFDLKKLKTFEDELVYEAYRDIFFLRTTKKIEAFRKGTRLFTITKEIKQTETLEQHLSRQQITVRILYIKDGKERRRVENWVVYSLEGIEIQKDLEILGQKLKQQVAIALPLEYENGKITKRFVASNRAYYTLPVMPTGFSFNYNASKLYTTSGRGEFVAKEGSKRDWNLWQMDNMAELLADAINDLISGGIDPKIIYSFVPSSSQSLHLLDERLFKSFKAKVDSKEVRLFYTSKGVWSEKDGIFLNWDGLHRVLPAETGRNLIHQDLKRYAAVFQSYGINSIGLEELVESLELKYGTSAWKNEKSEDPNQIRMIFEYLGKKRIKSQLMEKLRKICILLTEEGILRSQEYGLYFPTDEKMPLIDKDDIIHNLTYNTPTSRKFLERKLKIKKLDLHHLIIDSFLPRVGGYNAEQKFEFIWYLVKCQRDVLRKRDVVQELRGKLRDFLIAENSNDPTGSIFFFSVELKEIFGNKLNYLSSKYEEQGKKENVKWKIFFRKIGVEETPLPPKVKAVAQEVESSGSNAKSLKRGTLLLKFLDAHWRSFYSKYTGDLGALKAYAWIPTEKKALALPTAVYINRGLVAIVGESQNFIGIKPPRNKGLINLLGLLSNARIDDVVKFLLSRIGESVGRDKPVPFRVYSFLDRNADSISSVNRDTLIQNRTIWFKGKLWKPNKLFIEAHRNEFGPNGWLRGYIQNEKISKLDRLCSVLGLNKKAQIPDSYLDWLYDVACSSENRFLNDWEIKLIKNAYSKMAPFTSAISDSQFENLKQKRVLLTSELQLKYPYECYLLRRSEEAIRKKVTTAGIVIPVVEAENAEHERLYLKLGANELAYSISSKRADTSETYLDNDLTEKLRSTVPWLDGFEYSSVGAVSDFNLALSNLKVLRVRGLSVLYSVEGADGVHTGNPIRDSCCLEKDEENILYLDEDFDLKNNEHLRLLSLNIIRYLNPKIDKVTWTFVVPSILFLGQMIGISPYYREGKPTVPVELGRPEQQTKTESIKMPRLQKILETNAELVVKHELISKDAQEKLLEEQAETLEEESTGKPLNTTKMFREKKHIQTVKSQSSITFTYQPKIVARKNWKLTILNGEEVYLEEGIVPPSIEKIKIMRILLKKIVQAMGLNPETVNLCVARATTDGYNLDGQLFFNVARNDPPFRWFGVVARELAYNHSHLYYPHVKTMIDLLAKGLENINTLLPEFQRVKTTMAS